MSKLGHTVIGVGTGAILYTEVINKGELSFSFTFLTFLIATYFGSLFPDIDIPTSTLGRYFKLFNKHMKHRGFTHTFMFMLIMGAIWYLIYYFYPNEYVAMAGIGFVYGIFTHLMMDILTPAGLDLFKPVSKVHTVIPIVKNFKYEQVFVLLFVIGLAATIIVKYTNLT